MLKIILRSYGAFPIFDKLVSRKRLVVGRNGPEFGSQRKLLSVFRVLLTVSIQGQSEVI